MADQTEFDGVRAELEADREQLTEQQAGLEQYQTELNLQKQQLDEREEQLNSSQAELEKLREKLNTQQSTFEAEQTSQAAHDAEAEQARAILETDREQLAEQQAGLEQYQTELDLQKQQLEEREEQLTCREQELAALISKQEAESEKTAALLLSQESAAVDQEDFSEQKETLDRLQAELEQKQAELQIREEQLRARELDLPGQDHLEADRQPDLDELAREKEKLSLDHDQLKIDREEIARQRDNLESQRLQVQKDQGELEDRERIIQIREQQLAEREQLIADVGLQPFAGETDVAETESQGGPAAKTSQASGSLLQSFLNQPSEEATAEQTSHEKPQVKTGSLLDLFTKKTDPETSDSENVAEQVSAAGENTEDAENADEKQEPCVADNADDPDSIAAYMEKLLERSRGGKPGPPSSASAAHKPASSSAKPVSESKAQNVHGSTLLTSSLLNSQVTPANLSIEEKLEALKKAPTHAQDKDAVRDALNSFRDVANYSARMAIARHSMKHQRTDLWLKGVLTGACVILTIIVFADSIWGINRLGIMKWATLAVTIAAIAQLLRAGKESHKLFPSRKSPESNQTKETLAEENELTHSEAQTEQTQAVYEDDESLGETLNAVNGIREQLELLSAEEEELQLLEEQLKHCARAHHDEADSLREEDSHDLYEFDRDEDQ